MMKHGYIGEFEIIDDHRAGKIMINLTGRINKCQVIRFILIYYISFKHIAIFSPRFDIALNDLEKWTSNLLPSRQFGVRLAFIIELLAVNKSLFLVPCPYHICWYNGP
jgi:small subunit ribosomal protein S15Ae